MSCDAIFTSVIIVLFALLHTTLEQNGRLFFDAPLALARQG
jgi:hypothetical protein